jgi:hypothetical protein
MQLTYNKGLELTYIKFYEQEETSFDSNNFIQQNVDTKMYANAGINTQLIYWKFARSLNFWKGCGHSHNMLGRRGYFHKIKEGK